MRTMMSRQGAMAVLLMSLLPCAAMADALQDKIEGQWRTQQKDGVVNIENVGGEYQGIIVGGDHPDRRDTNNPDPAQRNDLLRGKAILSGLKYQGNGKWSGGKIYDPNNGKTYSCNAELSGENILKLRGYIGISLIGRTELWTRESPTAASAH
ncbi:MAG: DUF2147 domain-containing protein [Gammaproteobacteria bacterium]